MGTNNNKILKRIALHALPSLPDALLQLLNLLVRDGTTFAEIADVLRYDPGLCVKALDLAYPAYSNNPRRLLSLEQVLADVGIDALKTLAFSTAVNQVFHRPGEAAQGLLLRSWWRWVRTAHLARLIAQRGEYSAPDEAYLGGLLHEVGRLAFAANTPLPYQEVLADETPRELADKEIERFGMSGIEASAALLEQLRIASFMADAVRYREEPAEHLSNAHALVKFVHLAAACADAVEAGYPLPFQAAERLCGLSPSQLDEISEAAEELLSKATRSLRMVDSRNSPDLPSMEKLMRGRLANEVREIGLLSRMRPNFSGLRSELDIFNAIRKALQILFDSAYPVFFHYDPQKNVFVGTALPSQNELINQLNVPLVANASALADAVLNREPRHSLAVPGGQIPTVIDDQIIRLTQQDGILCLPLMGKSDTLGVIALGIAEDQLPRIEPQIKLLATLTTQAGMALDSARWRTPGEPQAPDVERLGVSLSDLRKIVHEVNNPLTIMKNYIKILRLKLVEEDPAQRDLGVIDDEIDRVGMILRNLVEPASSRSAFRPELIDINALIFDLTQLTDDAISAHSNVTLRTTLSHAIPPVVADRDRLKQVLMNLIRNAVEAMPKGGTITISTRDNVVHDGRNYVEIEVHDDGPGIPDAVKAQLFEPGVSTKGGDHAGLGLSIVQGLVKEIRGQIHCTSESGHGTTFQIWLPRTRQ
jgi:signal transduction histidine kinase/HD-like signal output (HDOD) protein